MGKHIYPFTWTVAKLIELTSKIGSGSTPRGGSSIYQKSGTPLIRSMNVHFDCIKDKGIVFIGSVDANKLKSVEVKTNDILLNITGASIGRVNIAPSKYNGARVNQHVAIVRLLEGLCPLYLKHYLSSPEIQNFIANTESGATRQALTKEKIEDFIIPFPPLAEQKVIAAKLDELLAQVDSIKTRLDTIPNILKRFRQSVLAAAVSGKLTEDWRIENIDVVPFSEADSQLTEFRNKALSKLPSSWRWLKFSDVADVASNLQNPDSDPDAIHIAPNHIESGTGRLLEFTTIREDKVTSPKHRFHNRQIIYSKIRPYLCKVALVDFSGLCSADMYPINAKIKTHYLYRWMLSAQFTDWASNAESRSVLPKINQKDLSKIPVPTPPIEEQTEIVRRVEQLFAFADQIEQQVKNAQSRVNNLTQSILAKAFRGELTADWRAQNPELISGEHSAEALLARIKAERAAMQPLKQKRAGQVRVKPRKAG